MKRFEVLFKTYETLNLISTALIQSASGSFNNKVSLINKIAQGHLVMREILGEIVKLPHNTVKAIISQFEKIKGQAVLKNETKIPIINQYNLIKNNMQFEQHFKSLVGISNSFKQKIQIQTFNIKYVINQFGVISLKVVLKDKISRHIINQFSKIENKVSLQQSKPLARVGRFNFLTDSIKLVVSPVSTVFSVFRQSTMGMKLSFEAVGGYDVYKNGELGLKMESHLSKPRIVRRRKLNEWTGTLADWSNKTLDDMYYL